jgi:AbrB family looped-hinge helix DNA binding protein
LKWEFEVEIQVGNKGRMTLPLKLRMMLGIKEGDTLTIEVTSKGILLKPMGASSKELWGAAKLDKVEIQEIEEALGKES